MAKRASKGRSSGKGGRFDRIVVAGIVLSLLAIVLTLWGPLRKFRGEEKRPVLTKKLEPASRPPEKKDLNQRGESPPAGPGASAVRVAVVIDDLGQDLKQAREVLSLPGKVTVAVMPGLAQSRKTADLARQSGREVLLHLPMEYRGRNGKPAAGMLRSDMTPLEFLNTVSDDVSSVPGAVGVNNHEGSALTENKEAMKFLMAELKARNLIFLDSLTSPKSVAYATAKEFGLKAAKRDVFLDNESGNAGYIDGQFEELARIAKEHGRAIGIGHPHPATISALRKWLVAADKQGISIVPVSKLMQ